MSAPAGQHSKALKLPGEKLAEAGLTEGQLVAWLKNVDAVPHGIFALQSIPTRRLEILLENWNDILTKL